MNCRVPVNMPLTPERKQQIDDVVASLATYHTPNGIDYNGLAVDYSIFFAETSRIAASAHLTYQGVSYIFGANHFIPGIREYELAHEFGHFFLRHSQGRASGKISEPESEREANYFATGLTGKSLLQYRLLRMPEIWLQMLLNTGPAWRFTTGMPFARDIVLLMASVNPEFKLLAKPNQ